MGDPRLACARSVCIVHSWIFYGLITARVGRDDTSRRSNPQEIIAAITVRKSKHKGSAEIKEVS